MSTISGSNSLSAPTWTAAAFAAGAAVALGIGGRLVWKAAKARGLNHCFPEVAVPRPNPTAGRPVHVLLAICDHYEPQCGRPPAEQADARVTAWVERYPALFGAFRDSDGRPPRHSFFFPIDEYDAGHVDRIAALCRRGFGEVEIHHHHDNDTAAALQERLLRFKELFHRRHGLLSRDRHTGEIKYGFVHGNWALCDSRPDGRHCGVPDEIDVLRQTGCYADFTMPSAPSPTQSRTINSLYYATTRPGRRSHDVGVAVGAGQRPGRSLMLIQGPLLLDWHAGRLLPRLENGNLQGNQPPTMRRLDSWLRAAVRVPSRPDWYFVKLHTHGAPEANQRVLLGPAMRQFHQDLAERAAADVQFHYHYVTAREMYNLARAAESGWTGTVEQARDFELVCDSCRNHTQETTCAEPLQILTPT